MSVCSSMCVSTWNNSAPTGQILIKFDIWTSFENLSRKLKFYWNLSGITGTLHENVSHLWQYLAEFCLQWEMFQIKVVDKIKIHIFCSVTFFKKLCYVWDNVENMMEPERPQMATWQHVSCWISKATHIEEAYTRACTPPPPPHTHTQTYLYIYNTAFPRQLWFREWAWMLHYTYMPFLFLSS
jgi:hypothetical protein